MIFKAMSLYEIINGGYEDREEGQRLNARTVLHLEVKKMEESQQQNQDNIEMRGPQPGKSFLEVSIRENVFLRE